MTVQMVAPTLVNRSSILLNLPLDISNILPEVSALFRLTASSNIWYQSAGSSAVGRHLLLLSSCYIRLSVDVKSVWFGEYSRQL
jgi:hypothetical protein